MTSTATSQSTGSELAFDGDPFAALYLASRAPMLRAQENHARHLAKAIAEMVRGLLPDAAQLTFGQGCYGLSATADLFFIRDAAGALLWFNSDAWGALEEHSQVVQWMASGRPRVVIEPETVRALQEALGEVFDADRELFATSSDYVQGSDNTLNLYLAEALAWTPEQP